MVYKGPKGQDERKSLNVENVENPCVNMFFVAVLGRLVGVMLGLK